MAHACFEKQTLRKANTNAMLLRAIDGRCIRSFVFSHRKRMAMTTAAASVQILHTLLVYIYTQIYTTCKKANQLRYRSPRPRRALNFCTGRGSFCVGSRRSMCQVTALSVLGPGALCVGPRRSLCDALHALCVGPQRSLCRGPALSVSGLALFVYGPGALCVRPRRCLPLSLSLSLSLSGPGSLCVGSRRCITFSSEACTVYCVAAILHGG